MSSPQTTSDLTAVADALRTNDRFLLITHENPDGDALGSILAAKLVLDRFGKDSVMYLSGQAPLPAEYKFMPLDGLRRELPDDAAERVLFALDCANESRLGEGQAALGSAPLVLNVDHHHDNSRFGQVNLVVADASSTGEILRDLIRELDVPLTPEIAEAIYVALVTDTGRFQYANTTPKALRLAAELVEAGADVRRVFQSVYESVQLAKLKLLARALDRAQVYEGGGLVVSYLLKTDFAEVGAAEPYSEGIIDLLRAVEGADMAALIREPPAPGRPARRVSLRSSSDELDVSAIARASGDGGGHRQAAGFSSTLEIPQIVDFLRQQYLDARASARA
jgi:phosphoesterase RecJ-like protein